MKRILCSVLLPLVLAGCSVKEDRSVCPCSIAVRSSVPLATEGSVLVSVIQEGSVVKQGMMSREDFEREGCTLTVPRKPSTVTVFTGITQMDTDGGRRLDIKAENQCDELFSASESLVPDADSCSVSVTPHKNYAQLKLIVTGMPSGGRVRIVGTVGGYDLLSLDPCEGLFIHDPECGGSGFEWNLRLPRQTDDSLSLEIISGGKTIQTVPAGRLIAESGYSFDVPDLPDITLTVDLSRSSAFVQIADWEGVEFTIVDY